MICFLIRMSIQKKFHKILLSFLELVALLDANAFSVNRIRENITDEDLLEHYRKSGELAYLTEAYKRYMPLVYGVALKYLKKPEDAQDAVMQLFEELIDSVKKHTIQQFKPWLYTCIRNLCLMELRRKNRNLSVSLDDSFMEFCTDFHPYREEATPAMNTALSECMEILPEKQQISVRYFFMEELSYKEIEKRTGFPVKKVKSFIQNGKRNLKLCLENKGIVSYEEE